MAGMSFAERAKLFAALADLEMQYGVEMVRKAIEGMAEIPEEKTGFDFKDIDWKKVGGKEPEQMELLPVPGRRSRNSAGGRRRDGENDRLIQEWMEKNHPGKPGSEVLVKMYYVDRLTQREIGEKIGVNQRAISAALAHIPKQFIQKVIAGWSE